MGSPTVNQRRLSIREYPEETPHGLCQNRLQIARADGPIFGGTFSRVAEGPAAIYDGDDLWDPGAAIAAVDGDITGFRGEDFSQEERGTLVTTVGTFGVMEGSNGKAFEDGGAPDRRGDTFDPGYLGLEQEVREAHGVYGQGEGWEREGRGTRVLDVAGDRGRDREYSDHSSLWATLLSAGPGLGEREYGDSEGDRRGFDGHGGPWDMGFGSGWRPGETV